MEDSEEQRYIIQLEGAIREIAACVEAKRQLDSGFKGMGYNILQEKVGKLDYEIRRAKNIIDRYRESLAILKGA